MDDRAAQTESGLAAALLTAACSIGRIGGWMLDAHTRKVTWTDEVYRLHDLEPGCAPEMALAIAFYEPSARPLLVAALEECIRSGEPIDLEFPLVSAKGRRVWVSLKGAAEREGGRADGAIVRLVGAVQDISQRRQAEQALRESEDRYRGIFDNAADSILVISLDGFIRDANPRGCQTYGYTLDEFVGLHGSQFVHPDHAHKFGDALACIQAGRPYTVESVDMRKGGEPFAIDVHISPFVYRGEAVMLCSIRDITERQQQEEAVWRQANFDALTGLANRSLFRDRLERALVQARRNQTRAGLIFIDLDAFKSVNDTLGHDAGDAMLVEVARRLQGCVREHDTVARLGGDEFTIVVHDVTDADDLRAVGDKAIGVLRDPFTLAGTQRHVTGSAGITVFPDDGQDVQSLLRNADIAMYKSKQTGANRCHFYAPQMQAEALLRLRLEAELRDAVARRAFVLHYQPIIDADSGELVGAEALLRWRHPERGLLTPAEFIGAAEESGLIHPIGEWVLYEAARQWRRWHLPGQPALRLALNVSGVQLRAGGLNDQIARALEVGGFGPGELVLELSEATLADGGQAIPLRLPQLKALGVGCTLDRFGTGFSSLAGLRRVGVDVIKIDRSFLQGCPQDRDNAHLVEAIVAMAHSLGLRVAACGVETEAQMIFLRDLGCDHLQGHLIGMPMPAAEFEALASRRLRQRGDGTSLEGSRLLAALRRDELDVDEWLRRLFDEQSPELTDYLADRGWMSRGLDLRSAVKAHLHCRRCLSDFVFERATAHPAGIRCAEPGTPCTLQAWVAQATRQGDLRFAALGHVLGEYHRLASQIAADCRLGYRDSARRALVGLKFRTTTRDVVLALVDGFKDAGHTAPGELAD